MERPLQWESGYQVSSMSLLFMRSGMFLHKSFNLPKLCFFIHRVGATISVMDFIMVIETKIMNMKPYSITLFLEFGRGI